MIMIAKKISNLHWFIQKYVDIVKNNLNDFFPSTHTCACAPFYLLNIVSDFSSVIRRWLNNSPLMNEVVKLEQHLDHLSSHWFRDLNNRLIVTTTHTICHSGPENSSKESLNQFHDFFYFSHDISILGIWSDMIVILKGFFANLIYLISQVFFCLWLLKKLLACCHKKYSKNMCEIDFFWPGLYFIFWLNVMY